MKSILVTGILLLIALAVSWSSLPLHTRDYLLGLIGAGSQDNQETTSRRIANAILPKNPEERRQVLIGELKSKMDELRGKIMQGGEGRADHIVGDSPLASGVGSTEAIIDSAQDLLDQLSESNNSRSFGGKIIGEIIDRVMPAQDAVCQPDK